MTRWWGYWCREENGKGSYSNVSGFIKDFCCESGDKFWEADKKKVGKVEIVLVCCTKTISTFKIKLKKP